MLRQRPAGWPRQVLLLQRLSGNQDLRGRRPGRYKEEATICLHVIFLFLFTFIYRDGRETGPQRRVRGQDVCTGSAPGTGYSGLPRQRQGDQEL